jgi:hypothetical protein
VCWLSLVLFWPQLKRGNREPGIIFQKEIACGKKHSNHTVEMRNTCQVTNQSSHGELSFHHNPQLRPCWGLCLSTSRVIRREGTRLKNAAHPTYCHCCELCALKQKPGVLLEKHSRLFGNKPPERCDQKTNPNCRPYSSPHQVPKHKMLWYIEKGTLREVGKIDA